MQMALKASPGAQRLWAKEQEQRSRFAKALPYGHPASYAAVISPKKSATRKAMLMGGPQFEFQLPSALYEVGLHGAGIDCIGSTLAGYPFIMFGHNRRAAFSSTAGADNIEDIFAEKLNPANPRQYWYKGKWRNMTVRSETFKVDGQADMVQEFFYTVHGPVFYVDEANGVAFSKKLSCRDGFLKGLASFYDLMKAETVTEFNKAAMLSDMSINYFFANTDGDIAYYHLGLHPVRSKEVDVRLPTPGTGEFEWRSFIPKNQNPHQANPRNGYFVNWNNQPAPGWGHGDMATTDVWGGWGADSRVTNLMQQVEKKQALNQTDLKDIIKTIGFYDKRAINIKTLLIEAVQGIDPMPANVGQALQLLSEWDNLNIDENRDGSCDHAGSAIFDRWWYKAVAATFADWYPGYVNAAGQSAVDILSNRYLGYTLFMRALNGTSGIDYFNGQKAEILFAALTEALDELAGNYQLPTPMYGFFPVTVLGFFLYQPITSSLEPPLPFPYVDRGTENHIVTLFGNNILGENITSPGNSGFKAFDATVSDHFYDQFDMFLDFTYKPMLFTPAQVNPKVESTITIKWE
jgi:penicillin amidase